MNRDEEISINIIVDLIILRGNEAGNDEIDKVRFNFLNSIITHLISKYNLSNQKINEALMFRDLEKLLNKN